MVFRIVFFAAKIANPFSPFSINLTNGFKYAQQFGFLHRGILFEP
jgi:hypothetical protein